MENLDASPKVLVVEDHISIAQTIELYLNKSGIFTVHCSDGEQAIEAIKKQSFDLILLDIMLPGQDGFAVCRKIRENMAMPVLMLTAKSTEDDIIDGLELGADDYITKPFKPRELVARVKSHLRRYFENKTKKSCSNKNSFTCKHIHLNISSRELYVNNILTKLTKSEFLLLVSLMRRQGSVFTRNQLIESAFGYDYEGSTRTLDTHLYNLRKKIEVTSHKCEFIHTEHGVGYRFEYIKTI